MCRSETPNLCVFAGTGIRNAPTNLTGHGLPPRGAIVCSVTASLFLLFLQLFLLFKEGATAVVVVCVCSGCVCCSQTIGVAAEKETLHQPCWPPCM
ncbi:hypothetical protein V8C42DRAFT_320028 [Trichoderma barbatum]